MAVLPSVTRGVLAWSLAAASLGVGLVLAERSLGPLDDVDSAYQRDGLVVDLGPVDLSPHLPVGTPGALLFVRPGMLDAVAAALSGPDGPGLAAEVHIVVAQPRPPPALVPGGLSVVDDTGGRLRGICRMRPTRDGGYPVGFAVVDADGHLRYRTLDPGLTGRWFELRTMVRAVTR